MPVGAGGHDSCAGTSALDQTTEHARHRLHAGERPSDHAGSAAAFRPYTQASAQAIGSSSAPRSSTAPEPRGGARARSASNAVGGLPAGRAATETVTPANAGTSEQEVSGGLDEAARLSAGNSTAHNPQKFFGRLWQGGSRRFLGLGANGAAVLQDREGAYPEPVAGVDEAGCAPLAGPVVAAAVILDRSLPARDRRFQGAAGAGSRGDLARLDKVAAVGVGIASVEEIDRAQHLLGADAGDERAVEALGLDPAMVLVDGNRCPRWERPVAWRSSPATGGAARSRRPRSSPR